MTLRTAPSRGAVTCLSYSSTQTACALWCRQTGPFGCLARWGFPQRCAHRFSMRSTVARRPQVGLVTHFRRVTGSAPVTRLPGYPVTRLPGYPVTRLPGYLVTRLPGYPVTRLPVSVSPNPDALDWVERGISASSARCLAASGITRTARRRVGRGKHPQPAANKGVAAPRVRGWHTPWFGTR
jgi:hypothetical protein